MSKSAGRIAGLVLILAGALALRAQDLTVREIIRLKRLGFSDADVKAEVVKGGKPIAVTPADLQALKDAGAGDELIRALQAPVPKPLALADIVRMTRDRQSADRILDALIESGAKYAITAAEGADLVRQDVDPAVILALKGRPLGLNELKLLAEGRVPEGIYLKLKQAVGFEAADLSAGNALALDRAGVPEAVLALLRQPPAGAQPAPPQQGQKPTPPAAEEDEHPSALVGTWEGTWIMGTMYVKVQITFKANGDFHLLMGSGIYEQGIWAARDTVLLLTPDNSETEGDNMELNGNRLKIKGRMGTLDLTKVR